VIVTSTDPNNPSCPSDPVTSIVEGHTVGTIASLIPSVAFDENGSITVVMTGGTGGYLYALSPSGPWQESNVFTNLSTGNVYTVYVTDENGCTSDSQSIYLIGYPHFFTPNGDGANDTWNIWDLEDQPSAEIHIFDRYGKLIKQITPAGGGWDGTFNGEPLPSTDYWFTVKFIDPANQAERVFKAHFSMKR
ncbi:T9SS type B sorting domain-containing protein, partial [Flavobacterium enshiense]|uniref:T9SS type B sorting domain-containing protein n=1 Tax=Flavobacterium enshiense TaxID=1341165 RepID=UPI00345D497B